jgi:cytochrome c556
MRTIIRRISPGAGIVLLAILAGAPAQGQDEDFEGIIKYRQGLMKAQAGHMTALAQLVRGRVADPKGEQMRLHARSLEALLRDLDDWFPEGSDFGETRAEERIWEQWDKFHAAYEKSEEAAEALVKAVEGGERKTIAKAFKGLADTCKACHKDFRAEEE